LLILASLSGGPKDGHAIMTDVIGFSSVSLEPGTLYGALARLEHRGWVESLPKPSHRRQYELTAAGRRVLRERPVPVRPAAVDQRRPAVA
jgi:DNA-binding PadR family transcriptional regulator